MRHDLPIAFIASLLVHKLLLGGAFDYMPAEIHLQQGKEAFALTLLPSAPAPQEKAPPVEEAAGRTPRETPETKLEESVTSEAIPEALESADIETPPSPPQNVPDPAAPDPDPDGKTEQPPDAESPEETAAILPPAPEWNGSLEEHGIDTAARVAEGHSPAYPLQSRRRGEEGRVIIAAEICTDGTPGELRVVSSSGYRRLDEAAVAALRKSAFTPATKAGRPIRATTEWTFIFRLKDAP